MNLLHLFKIRDAETLSRILIPKHNAKTTFVGGVNPFQVMPIKQLDCPTELNSLSVSAFIRDRGPFTCKELAYKCGVSKKQIWDILTEAMEQGFLVRWKKINCGPGRKEFYYEALPKLQKEHNDASYACKRSPTKQAQVSALY